ncbi:hypothetical protein D3C75_854270 [compost metagenome]
MFNDNNKRYRDDGQDNLPVEGRSSDCRMGEEACISNSSGIYLSHNIGQYIACNDTDEDVNNFWESAEHHGTDYGYTECDHRQRNGFTVRSPVRDAFRCDQPGHARSYRHQFQSDGCYDSAHYCGRKYNINPACSGITDD